MHVTACYVFAHSLTFIIASMFSQILMHLLILQVTPSCGTILPMSQQVVLVEFCSQVLQVYTDHFLALDIMTVGEGLHTLPIKAECVVPTITPHTNLLDFEQCFLR